MLVLALWNIGISQTIKSAINNAYVPSEGFISIFSNHTFSDHGNYDIIYTNKGTKPGYVNFAKNSSWSNANDNSYIDGYVRVLHDGFFTFPVGDLGFYKPISISGASGTSVAYFFEDVAENSTIQTYIENRASSKGNFLPSASEYWVIKGDKPTRIIMHWNEDSDLKSIADDVNEIMLLGWNGNAWEVIDSEINEFVIDIDANEKKYSSIKSNIEYGSLESSEIIPDKYSIVTFGTSSNIDFESYNTVTSSNSNLTNEEFIEMTVFPNPIDNLNNLKIDYNLVNVNSSAYVVVYDNLGRLLIKEELKESKGIYSLRYNEETDQMYNVGIVTNEGSKKMGSVLIGSR